MYEPKSIDIQWATEKSNAYMYVKYKLADKAKWQTLFTNNMLQKYKKKSQTNQTTQT